MDGFSGKSQGRLKSIVERLERLEEDKKAVTADLGEVYAEAKGEGFDTKILRKVIRWRATDKVKREEEEALLDIYLAALGEAPGGPGGRAEDTSDAGDDPGLPFDAPESPPAPPPPPKAPPDSPQVAGIKGREAAKAGQPITSNPYPAGDPCRPAWDEAWCAETGTDGMDVPDAWKPGDAKKPGGDA